MSLPAPALTVSLPPSALIVSAPAVPLCVLCRLHPHSDHVAGSRQREVGDVDVGVGDTVDLDRALDGRGRAILTDGDERVAADWSIRTRGGEVRRRDAEPAEIDAILGRRRAARGVEAVDDVGAEAGGVVDDRVDAAADIDGVVAGTADDRVVVVAAVERVVAVAAVEQVVAVIAVERVVAPPPKSWLAGAVAVDDVVERVAACR